MSRLAFHSQISGFLRKVSTVMMCYDYKAHNYAPYLIITIIFESFVIVEYMAVVKESFRLKS